MKLEFPMTYFQKILKISNFMKICPVGAKFFQTERQTDRQTGRQAGRQTDRNMMNLIVAFHNFANAPKNA